GGGGGGGGFFGGGGGGGDADPQAGNAGGGGGGSSFVESSASNVSMMPASTGSPSVTITYEQPSTLMPAAVSDKCTTTANRTQCVYDTTGERPFTVPAAVSTLHIVAVGAAGGDSPGGGGGGAGEEGRAPRARRGRGVAEG